MGYSKKRFSSVLVMLLVAFTFLGYVPAKAAEMLPKITFVGVEHSPLVVGDSEVFYLSSVGTEKVQYRVFQNKIGTDKWEELTQGYTFAVNANEIKTINGLAKYEAGKYKLSIWVKNENAEGKFKNATGTYDSYYITYLNCVSKDNNNRVYTNGDMNVEKDEYEVGETVKVNGIKDISGMKTPYTYKLHIYDVNNDVWTLDKATYRDKENLTWVANKPGTYVLDLWAMSSNSTLWAKEAKLGGSIYEAWKLKVITVKAKVEPTEINIVEKGTIYGSEDAKNPMEINKNVNITGNNVVLNNVNVKGSVTVTGDNVTLNNVKVEGALVLNPGEKGTANINNVIANNIEVLSGAKDSIHLFNVDAKTLNISSDSLVRVESKGTTKIGNTTVHTYAIIDSVSGSFGEITVSIIQKENNESEQVVELRGTFNEPIIMENGTVLKAAENAKISKVVIEPLKNEKITLDGVFGQVEVNKPSTVATTSTTTISQITTNSPATLEIVAGSKVATLDKKGQIVTQTGTGTISTTVNPPVTVVPPVTQPTYHYVTGVAISQATASMVKGSVINLSANVSPSNASNKSITWASSNTSIATVDASGKVTAMGKGIATITVTTDDGKKTDTCVITVSEVNTEFKATSIIDGNRVSVLINNLNVSDQIITIVIYNKADSSLAFIDQLQADVTGKVTFTTNLGSGDYNCIVKAVGASLTTTLDLTIGQ